MSNYVAKTGTRSFETNSFTFVVVKHLQFEPLVVAQFVNVVFVFHILRNVCVFLP